MDEPARLLSAVRMLAADVVHDGQFHEVPDRDLFLDQARIKQRSESLRTKERMKPDLLGIFRQVHCPRQFALAHDVGNR